MSLNNQTLSLNDRLSQNTVITVLNLIQQRFLNQLPLIIPIIGVIGFFGNLFTFLQPNLRGNSFCIYTLCGSLVDVISLFANLFPLFLYQLGPTVSALNSIVFICKLKFFFTVFLPQLSMNLLIMSLIDRFACTFDLNSSMRSLLKLKSVPYAIIITILVSCLMSLYSPILYDVIPGEGCGSVNPSLFSVLYMIIHGILTPLIMLILVYLTYRRFKRNRQRVGALNRLNMNRFRNSFISTAISQSFVTCLFAIQWMTMYWFFLETVYNYKSEEQTTIISFCLSVSNYLYYVINIRSFYLSTLTSQLFRQTLKEALWKLVSNVC